MKRGVHSTITYPIFETTKENLREILDGHEMIIDNTVEIGKALIHLNKFMEACFDVEVLIDSSSFEKPSNLGENYYVMVVDRDQQSYSLECAKEIKEKCEKNGYGLIITNPNFELWIAMHFDGYDRDEMLECIGDLVQKKYVDRMTRAQLGDVKLGPYKIVNKLFQEELGKEYKKWDDFKWAGKKVRQALANSQSLCTDLDVLINDLTLENYPTTIGTNIGELFKLLMDPRNQKKQPKDTV